MSGCLEFLKCVYNYSYCMVCCCVVGGCMYSQLYRELYCVWVEYCSELQFISGVMILEYYIKLCIM